MSQRHNPNFKSLEWFRQEYFKEFYDIYNNKKTRRVLFFVGSGPSIGVDYPTWVGLLRDIRRSAESKYPIKFDEPEFEKRMSEGNYAEAGTILKKAINVHEQPEQKTHTDWWREILNKIFESKTRESHVHKALVQLKWEKMITTNYDCLIEAACDQADITYNVYHPWVQGMRESLHTYENVIFKIHGNISDKSSRVVLTKEDYDEIYINEHKHSLEFREVLKYHLDNAQVILFIGYSHDDRYFREWFKKVRDNIDSIPPTFALFPSPNSYDDPAFDNKLEALRRDVGIRAITFKQGNDFAELYDILQYLRDIKEETPSGATQKHEKKPTVILLYTGGTIGSIKNPGDLQDVLSLRKIPSRFDPRLNYSSKLLREKFRQFYHTGEDFKFDLIWEILPADQQILSENATVEHWNNLLNKLEQIIDKYVQEPGFISENDLISNMKLFDMYKEEVEEFKKLMAEDEAFRDLVREDTNFSKLYPKGMPEEKDFLNEVQGRYIAGIVILHGTDTMAHTAAALAFGMRNLPVPIVLTGANRPPDEHKFQEKSEIYWESDTWKNLVMSLYFLQCFGHRFTEVFLCFGDTVHYGLNLRKTAIETVPLKRGAVSRYNSEPFTFRNYSIYKQYMFRLIDDVFCNNYYPSQLPYSQLILPSLAYLRHVRQNPFRPGNEVKTIFYKFKPAVKFIVVSPSFPPIDVDAMLEDEDFRAVLIEGYKSGTYPSKPNNHFSVFMNRLEKAGIPMILVSHYGIPASVEKYETEGLDIPVIPLFGVIAETALPMLNLLVGKIEDLKWNNSSEKGSGLAQYRRDLITSAIREVFNQANDDNKNIISLEFGDITDQNARRDSLNKIIQEELQLDQKRPGPVGSSSTASMIEIQGHLLEKVLGVHSAPQEIPVNGESQMVISRADFLWYFGEMVRPAEKIGAGPDGFSIMTDMGFDWGFYLFQRYQLIHNPRIDDIRFRDKSAEEREGLKTQATNMLKQVVDTVKRRGIANIDNVPGISFNYETGTDNGSSADRPYFSFEIIIYRGDEFIRSDEKFTAQTYSEEEDGFFTMLEEGPDSPQESDEHFNRLSHRYEELLNNTWRHKTTSLDWFLLGAFRGVACAMACYFLFDDWAVKFEINQDHQHFRALRQSVKCKIIRSQRDVLRFVMTYYAWNQSETILAQ